MKVIRHQFSAFSSTFTTIPFSHIELDALRSEMDACKSNHTSSNHPNSSDTLVFVYSNGSFKGYFKTVTKPFIAIYRKSGRVCNVTSPTPWTAVSSGLPQSSMSGSGHSLSVSVSAINFQGGQINVTINHVYRKLASHLTSINRAANQNIYLPIIFIWLIIRKDIMQLMRTERIKSE